MIEYVCKEVGDGNKMPVSLEVYGIIYTYPNDKLFEHLVKYIPCQMTVKTYSEDNNTFKTKEQLVTHYYVNESGVPTILVV